MRSLNAVSRIGLLLAVGLLAACASKVAEKHQYSGFLGNYDDLQSVQTASGHQTLRWISPDYHESHYKSLSFDPVIYYPRAAPDSRVSADTLEQIRLYAEQRLKAALGQRMTVVNQPQPGGLRVKTAITAVTASNKDVQFYEVIPVGAVIAGAMAVSGHRSQNSELFLELEAIDVTTGKPLIKVVRKGTGKQVANNSAPITAADVKSAIDDMVRDVASFPHQ